MQQKIDPFLVVAFILTTTELTLYSPTGESRVIKQGDPRVARLVHDLQPVMAVGGQLEVELGEKPEVLVTVQDVAEQKDHTNYYGQAEAQSNGVVKFFRIARSAVRKFFGKQTEPVVPVSVPEILEPTQGGVIPVPVTTQEEQHKEAIAEVMANAIPASSPKFSVPEGAEADDATGDTLVAVVGDTLIPNVEALAPQIKHAVKSNSTKGVQRLMERVATVAKKRGHSVEDLMKFMQIGDLPVNDNGDLVVFKALKTKNFGDRFDHRFKWADIHSGNVPQRLGSYVYMDESLVDPDRRQDCSNGLHIASRSYLSGFRGDVCVIALVRPEDVIAVPEYNHNKMRVCGYHIVAELTSQQYNKLLNNQTFTDDEEGQLLLGRIMEGKHIPVTNKVRITAQKGGGIQIEELDKDEQQPTTQPEMAPVPEKPVKAPKRKAVSLDNPWVPKAAPAARSKPQKPTAAPVDVKAVAQKAKTLNQGSQSEQAAALYSAVVDAKTKGAEKEAAQALLDFKKKAKKSWTVLGLASTTGEDLAELLAK
ncbi:hypothetical protein JJJA_0048 [Achromobacter phage JWDelta]|uniref:RIIB-like protein n=1 Tax=Achromobacter phage JWDelta TaxID=1416008 RepID=V9SHP1_9CAUD|nr:hypothetical protein JJJA_0048 [Achromobacter phage JWDelta]